MFAPLYLSNYCINGCTYCPYHAKTGQFLEENFHWMKLKKKQFHFKILAIKG